MKEIYISWVKGLVYDKQALDILKSSGVIAGIELSNVDEQIERIQDSGLKVSLHCPGQKLTTNLAAKDFKYVFERKNGILEAILKSDAPIVGFHCGYAAEEIYKMKAFPNIPKGALITDEKELVNRISENLNCLDEKINSQKQIVIETLDYTREQEIKWKLQSDEVQINRYEIERIISIYGTNASLLYVNEPKFIEKILSQTKVKYLCDTAHIFITADTKIHNKEFNGEIEDYFIKMNLATTGKIYQIHLSVPAGDAEKGYSDVHKKFVEGDYLSSQILDLTKEMIEPELKVVTLEIDTRLKPTKHAKEMVKQAEYIMKKLF